MAKLGISISSTESDGNIRIGKARLQSEGKQPYGNLLFLIK